MKKALFLLALALSANAEEPNYSNIKVQGAEIENFVETTYKHPEAKKVGDLMPLAIGKPTYYMDMYSSNKFKEDDRLIICYARDRDKETIGAVKDAGLIICYARDRDKETIGAVKDAGLITGYARDRDKETIGAVKDTGLITGYDRDRDKETIGVVKYAGRITGYDRDGDEDIAEYEFIRRYCDVGSDVETYAVFDISNELIYVDSSRDKYIDAIVECRDIDSLESAVLYMRSTECEENKAKKVEELGGK